ncbi:hypothetical protein [Streptomyces brasiliensis]|uniref:Uncharacterized protein n=1 Tax=Streptomyces brasiliensis TaxID=1954 RepID=A0A917NQE2_9ACTN|nr:hypothetical protein [Streptomyces brasiliensis]GGJ19670.1 hypothetical protein GCM10010121_033300 [Streptomyces brasiliensis]
MPIPQPPAQPRPHPAPAVSMRDLLASCAAADVISKPPRDPEPKAPRSDHHGEHPHAA